MSDFYLASRDDDELSKVRRACAIEARLPRQGADALLVQIEPPLDGSGYGLANQLIDRVVVAPKWENVSVVDIEAWPVPVFVLLPLVDLADLDLSNKSTYSVLAWGYLEPS